MVWVVLGDHLGVQGGVVFNWWFVWGFIGGFQDVLNMVVVLVGMEGVCVSYEGVDNLWRGVVWGYGGDERLVMVGVEVFVRGEF